jgi:hypothetical protein
VWLLLFFLCVLVYANSPEIPLACIVSCVFIGPSYKKIKFFVFFCRIDIEGYVAGFYSVEKSVFYGENRFLGCHFRIRRANLVRPPAFLRKQEGGAAK